jgi:predicted ribosome quality control (RQC) complex YloA/Tae2 family protein
LNLGEAQHMALSATEIERVLVEIAPVLDQARIQKIHQPGNRVLLFELRVPNKTHRLLVSCEPGTARLHLTSRPLPNPPSPPSFCQFLRAQVQGGRLEDIRQLGHDRIVALTVSTRQGLRIIVCGFTGHTANLLLLDDRRHVLRDLNGQGHLVGKPYQEPVPPGSSSIREKASRFDPHTTAGHFPISQAVEAHYHDKERTLLVDRAKQDRLRTLRTSLSKMLRRIDAWREDLARMAAYRDYGRYGELLKAHLASVTPGMEQITLVDYYDPALPEVTLPLDPAKSALQNMNDYFKKHRKHLTADRELHARIARGEQEADILRREITSVQEGTWTPPAAGSGREVRSPGSKRMRSAVIRRGPFRRFVSADGLPIFVGRNAAENEELTFRMANSDDLWLHARGTPGSHVVVRLAKGADPPLETLCEAATLALLYSDLKKSGRGDVIYTKRKWVKKAKGQAAGAVIVTHEKTISASLDPRRLEALKERSHASPSA